MCALVVRCRNPAAAAPGASRLLLDDLPERVLLDDPVAAEGIEVAAARLDAFARAHCPGDGPLRDTHVAVDEVTVIAVVDVGQPLEARSQAFANRDGANMAP